MNLIIVESPTKAKTLSRFLGKDFVIEASMGHIRDLPASKIGVDIANGFKPEYVVAEKKENKVKELLKSAKDAQMVILATDPDREGEAIAWHILSLLTEKLKNRESIFKRITFHEITESAIKQALQHPRDIDMNLVDAQQSRRILDRIVGYKLSPLLWKKIRRGLSAGRVQSVAVRLVVEREREILAFKPVEYWEIVGKFKSADLKNKVFDAKLQKLNNKGIKIISSQEAIQHVELLKKAWYQVSGVQTKEVKKNPYPPFTTSVLQQAASNVFGWSAKRTMQVAQDLYELGLITYHRTDSTNLAAEAVSKVRSFVAEQFGVDYVPSAPRFYKTKSKVAQEAHEAIRPTSIERLPTTDENIGWTQDGKKLYELIWKRFVACQMSEAIYEQKGIDISATCEDKEQVYLFRTVGNHQLFDGWQRLYPSKSSQSVKLEVSEKETTNNPSDESVDGEASNQLGDIPALKEDDRLDLHEIVPSQHFTEPPPRYNEASLIKTLEEFGIGRPSTYAPIITTIQERQYVEKADKKFQPTSLGLAVNDFLVSNFAKVMEYQFTAKMEDDLDQIANGEKQWVPVLNDFYQPFEQQLDTVGETAQRVKVEVEETDEICPEDGGKLVIRVGRFGKFLACANFPQCKYTKQHTIKIDVKCPKCQGDLILKRTKTKKTFYGCANYPKCDFASWNKPKAGE